MVNPVSMKNFVKGSAKVEEEGGTRLALEPWNGELIFRGWKKVKGGTFVGGSFDFFLEFSFLSRCEGKY